MSDKMKWVCAMALKAGFPEQEIRQYLENEYPESGGCGVTTDGEKERGY